MSSHRNPEKSASTRASETTAARQSPAEDSIPIDGFDQVVAMLRIADPAFRESMLKRLAAKDSTLARQLRRDLGI